MVSVLGRIWIALAAFLLPGLGQADELAFDPEKLLRVYCGHQAERKDFVEFYRQFSAEHGNANPFESNVFIATAPGDCFDAVRYYQEVGRRLGLTLKVGPDGSTVTQMVEFLGFEGMTANDLEVQPPDRLMSATQADFQALAQEAEFPDSFAAMRKLEDFQDGKVVAVRYFAPKVANYNVVAGNSALLGWRKLVRLQALEGSPATLKGIRAGWVLFNTIRAPQQDQRFGIGDIFPTRNNQGPYVNSEAIQIILERDADAAAEGEGPTLFFLTYVGKYERNIKGLPPYGLSFHLEAKFDVAGAYPDVVDGAYYVPGACAQCHGYAFRQERPASYAEVLTGPRARRLSLNYLATDQWYDARANGDFETLNGHDVPVLIDADPSDAAAYEIVFDRFRALNRLIADQNCKSQPADSLSVRSVATWLRNHATGVNHVDRWSRVLPPAAAGNRAWSEQNANDAVLLPMLDRYCARCHVTMFFGIYDKQSLYWRVDDAVKRIRGGFPEGKLYMRMPQGRELSEKVRADLIRYLDVLRNEPAPAKPHPEPEVVKCP